MGEQDEAQSAALGGILQGWDEQLSEGLPRPPSIHEDVVSAALDQKGADMRFEELWYEPYAVPQAVQVRGNQVEAPALHAIRAFIGVMDVCHNAHPSEDRQEATCQKKST